MVLMFFGLEYFLLLQETEDDLLIIIATTWHMKYAGTTAIRANYPEILMLVYTHHKKYCQ